MRQAAIAAAYARRIIVFGVRRLPKFLIIAGIAVLCGIRRTEAAGAGGCMKWRSEMKIVILDGYDVNPGDLSWEPLGKLGDLTVYDEMPDDSPETISRHIGDAEIVVTNKTPVGEEVFRACPEIRCISVAATGYNIVDVQGARQMGIPVCNVPHYGTDAVAQYTIALLLELTCHVAQHSQSVHEGKWEQSGRWCYWEAPLTELAGKTFGVIGFGSIGMQTARIAKAMGMRILAYSRSERPEGKEIGTYAGLDALLAQSDVVSLHCPLFPETKNIVNRNTLSRMKPGSILLNTSRGGLVEEAALAEALKSGHLSAAAVDVVSEEPIRGDNPLLSAPNCIITPHVAWTAAEARRRLIDITAENVRSFLEGHPIHVVNR